MTRQAMGYCNNHDGVNIGLKTNKYNQKEYDYFKSYFDEVKTLYKDITAFHLGFIDVLNSARNLDITGPEDVKIQDAIDEIRAYMDTNDELIRRLNAMESKLGFISDLDISI